MRVAMRKALSISWVTMMEVAFDFWVRLIINSSINRGNDRVESRRWLVQQDQFGLEHEPARKGHPFSHTAAEFVRQQVLCVFHPYKIEFFVNNLVNLVCAICR